jgi:tRNA nucleotidyltransferase (CCA-adding enzyme)
VTGERVRNELTLALREPDPEILWQTLADRGILAAIHDDFIFDQHTISAFGRAREVMASSLPVWVKSRPDLIDIYWHLIAVFIPLNQLSDICKRLLFAKSFADSLIDAAQIVQSSGVLADPTAPPSYITAYLENKILDAYGDKALFAAWLADRNEIVRYHIAQFASAWRSLKPKTNGHDLAALGLNPGKCYGIILAHLRAARLDGDVATDEQERALLMSLIEKHVCDETV